MTRKEMVIIMLTAIEKELAELFGGGDLTKDKYIGAKIKEGIWDQPVEFWRERNKDHKEEVPLADDLLEFAHQGHRKWEQTCLATIGVISGKVSKKHKARS